MLRSTRAKEDRRKLELRLRAKAQRRNLVLVKSAARDTGLPEYGKFALLRAKPEAFRGGASSYPYTIEDVERILDSAEWKAI